MSPLRWSWVIAVTSHGTGRDRERDTDYDRRAVDFDARDHAEIDDVAAELGVDHTAQSRFDVGPSHHGPPDSRKDTGGIPTVVVVHILSPRPTPEATP